MIHSSQSQVPVLVFENPEEKLHNFNLGIETNFPYGFRIKSIYSEINTEQNYSRFLKNLQNPENIFRKKLSLDIEFGLLESLIQHWTFKKLKNGKTFNTWLYYEKAEELALKSSAQYWNTYLSWIRYQQKTQSLKAYRRLVQQIQNKKKYDFLKPGEKPQVLAEYTYIKQATQEQKQHYEKEKEKLFLLINKNPEDYEIVFEKPLVEPLPTFSKIQAENTRPMKIQKNQIQQQEWNLKIHKTKLFPHVQMKGSKGLTPSSTHSENLSFSSKNSFYEFGLTFTWIFYSKSFYEKYRQEKWLLEENKIDREITKQELKNKIQSLEKDILLGYKKIYRSQKMNSYQKIAFKELKKSFEQGRADVFELIGIEQKLRESEIIKNMALAEYSQLLLQNLALRDQLVESYFQL